MALDCVKLTGLCFADEQDGGQLLLENILIYIIDRFCYEKHLASDIIRMGSEEEGIGIGVSSTLGIVFFFMLLFLAYKNRESMPTGFGEAILVLPKFIANMMPFAFLAYGIAGDIVNQEYRLSIPSIAAFSSMILVGPLSQVLAKNNSVILSPQDTSGTLWCTLPGLESIESPYLPTAFMSTAIIGFYYLCWAWHTPRPWKGTLLAFSIVFTAQVTTFLLGDCSSSYKPIGGSVLINLIISTVLGIAIGAISFASTFSNPSYNPYNLPGGSASSATGQTGGNPPAHLSTCPDGSVPVNGKCPYGPKKTAHSYPVQDGGDENTFVAELYKNGQLVTESIAA